VQQQTFSVSEELQQWRLCSLFSMIVSAAAFLIANDAGDVLAVLLGMQKHSAHLLLVIDDHLSCTNYLKNTHQNNGVTGYYYFDYIAISLT
jgi:hypothetical protein